MTTATPPSDKNNDATWVSVVVPCLNSNQFLPAAIDSILAQDYPHIECIVIDGGSTDGTLDTLRAYGDRITWVSEPDRGHADAINKGWLASRGRIVTWLNADDCWETPHAARLAVEYLNDHPNVDVVYGDCGWIDEAGNRCGEAYLHDWDLKHAVQFADHCIPQPAAFIRRSILDRVGMLDESVFTKDRELWLRIGLNGTIAYYPRRLAYARNTRGISYDGRKVAPAIVDVTRKFYSLPGVPDDLLAIKRRAISNAYLRGAYYAYEGGRLWSIYAAYVLRALITDPGNAPHAARHVLRYVRRALRDWTAAVPKPDTIGRISSNTPAS